MKQTSIEFGDTRAARTGGKSNPSYKLVFRSVAGPTNSRTAIAAIVPGHTALSNSAPEIAFDLGKWMRGK